MYVCIETTPSSQCARRFCRKKKKKPYSSHFSHHFVSAKKKEVCGRRDGEIFVHIHACFHLGHVYTRAYGRANNTHTHIHSHTQIYSNVYIWVLGKKLL